MRKFNFAVLLSLTAIFCLFSTAIASAQTTVSATTVNFGNVPVSETSAVRTVTLKNTGAASISISSLAVTSGTPYAISASSTCLNPTLAAGATCTVGVTLTPAALGAQPAGTLTITTTAPNSPQTVALTGTGATPTTLSTTALNFGNVMVGQASALKGSTLTNNRAVALSISSLALSGSGYALDSSTTCPNSGSLAAGASCKIGLTLTPAALGAQPGSVVITTNASNSPQTVTLTGAGVTPATLSTTALNFGNVVVGQASALKGTTLTNNQAVALTISSLALSGSGYALDSSTTCPNSGTLAAGASCQIGLTLTPAALGAQPGSVVITTNASNSPQTLTLTGAGVAAVSLAPSSIGFGSVAVTATSVTKTVKLTNGLAGTLSVGPVLFGGPFALDTGAATTCPISGGAVSGTLAGGASCVIGIVFQPTATGVAAGGQITVIDNAPNSPQVATLTGTGLAPVAVSPSTVAFGNVAANTTSASQNVTVTNNRAVPVNFASITAPAPYAVVPATTTCLVGTPVAPGGSCVISLSYSPTSVGATPATTLTISDDAPSSPQTVNLTGTGVVSVTLSSSGLNFGTVVVNNAVVKNLTLTNHQGVPLRITSITGFPAAYSLSSANTTCPFAPNTLAAGGSCVIAVSLTATATGAQPGTINVNDDAPSTPQTFTVMANAIQPVVVSPTSLTFSPLLVGTTSAVKTITLTNELSTPLSITSATITGLNASDFQLTTTCPIAPATLPGTSSCTLLVTFTPSGSGTRTASLNINDPLIIPLSGSGNSPVSLTQPFGFPATPVGTTSAYRTVTITNNSPSVPVHLTNLLLTGEFVQTSSSCPIAPAPLNGGSSCNVTFSFDPTLGGTRAGQLQVYENDVSTSPQVINLTGIGISPLTISPLQLGYPAQKVGSVSASKTITLINHEVQPETFTLTPAGDYTATTNCATGVIAANSSCLIYVAFAPSATGTRSGTLTVANSAPGGSPIVANFSGSGIATDPAAAVAVVSPGAGAAGTTVNVVITGNGWTHFGPSSVISFVDTNSIAIPSDIAVTVPNPATTTANTINAQLVITGLPSVVYGARNIKVATPLSGGGTEAALLTAAFIIADPTNAHDITTVAPAFGTQGQTLNVNLTATGTNFIQGTTYANFGDGITINSLTIVDATDAVANITISNTTPVGYRKITLVTGGEFAISSGTAFQIGPNSAALLSISPTLTPVNPTAEPQGWSGVVYLTASGTHFLQNATQVSFTGGILTPEVTVTSPTTAIVNVAVPALAAIGVQNATVWTGGEIASLNNAFTVIGSTPGLLSVAPSSALQGQTLNVTITGNAYTTFPVGVFTHPASDPLIADFTGEIAINSITVLSGSTNVATVNVTVSPNANVGGITAHLTVNPLGAATIFSFGFTVAASNAQITSVTPACIPQGGQLTLSVTALNTNWVQGTTTAAFYPVPYENITVDEITINTPTSALLNVSVSTGTPAGRYGFYMATGGQVVTSTMNVCPATPTLTISPANGLRPSGSAVNSFSVSFTGQFTHFGPTTLPVVSGEGVTLTNFSISSTGSATATINILGGTNGTPTALGPRLITFTTGGEIVTTRFNVTQIPVGIISISPYHTPQSTTVDVTFTGLNTHFTNTGANPTQVLFGPQMTVNTVNATDATHLTANITTSYTLSSVTTATPPGWQTVYVNTGAEQLIGGFLVDSPAQPRLVSVVPSSAQQGASVDVTITSSLTNWVQGTTEAILGAGVTVSNLQILSPTVATATIAVSPTAPVGGNSVIMITGSQVLSGTGFSVTPNAAYIYSVAPKGTCDANAVTYANFCGVSGGAGIPYVITQLQTATLNVVGVGTHWLQGETTFSFGPGVVTDSLTVSSPTTAQVEITVLSTSPVGFAALTTTTDGEVVTLQQAIDIEEGFPALLATSPGGALQGATLNLQVLGRYTNWGPTTTAAFNRDITVNSVTVIDSDNLVLNITVSPWAYVDYGIPCGHVLTVTTGTVQVVGNTPPGGVSPSYFCVQQGAEEITNVTPLQTLQGSTVSVTITGSATNFVAGVTQVTFGDPNFAVGQIAVNSPTSLTVPVAVSTAATPGFKTVTVTTYGQVASQQYSFTVNPGVATLNEAIPNQAEQGAPLAGDPPQVVRLLGQYSHFSSQSTATFGAGIIVQSVAYVSPTEVDATITIDPLSYTGSRLVTVTTPGVSCSNQPAVAVANVTYAGCTPGVPTGTGSEIVTKYAFSIIAGPAIISQVSPATGNEGQEVVFNITGANTHWAQNFTQFYIPGAGYDLTVNSVVINSPTSATVDLSISPTANPGARSISMITAGEALTDRGAFVVTGGVPVITYLSPSSTQNDPVTGTTGLLVTIHGLYTHWTAGVTSISFGPGITVSSFQVDDETHIEALIDIAPSAQIGYRTVQAVTGTQVLTSNFLVQAPAPPPTPYIWYESPSSGIPGQTFTITFYGSNTHWDPNPTTGTQLTGFAPGITLNTFQVTGPSTALANITISPTATASTSDLTLTTNTTTPQEVDAAQFRVIVAVPTLSVVDPSSAMQGSQNLTVNILGQYTNFDATTTFTFGSGITVNGPPTIIGPGIATQSISIDQLATLGYRSVIATTQGTPVGGGYFYVTPSLALIAAVTANTAKQGDTLQVEVTGQNTHWGPATVFQFGAGIVVTSYHVNSLTDATVSIALPALAPVGPTYVTATTLGEVANINNGFVVQAGTPLLLSSGPGSLPQQSSAVFTILSQATTWTSANPPTVDYGPGVVVTNVNVTGPTSMTVNGYVQPTTNVGWRDLTVTTGTQVLQRQYAFYVSPGPAVINSVTASSAGQGATLTVAINGINTHWLQGVTTLNFPNVLINSFTVLSANSISANITVNASAPAGQLSVTTTTVGEVATGTNVFTVIQTQPEMLAVVSSSGVQGWSGTVTITGAFTHFNTAVGCALNCSTANFGTGITVNSVNALSATSLQANITVQPTTTLGYRNVSVTTGGEVISLTSAFNVTVGPAAIQGALNPAGGAQNQSYNVIVTGSQTHFLQGATTANFGSYINVTGVTVTDALHATVAITIPPNTPLNNPYNPYNVSLTTGGEVATILGGFTVTNGSPQLSVVNPPTGHQGDTSLSVNLTGLFTHFNTAPGCSPCSTVSFGAGITATLTASSATSAVAHITIDPAATIGSRNVSVTTGTETASITGGFSVLAGLPQLVSATAASAPAGSTANIVIVGEFTSFLTTSSVNFGSGILVNYINNVTATQLTANITIAGNATVGNRDITVTTNGVPITLPSGFAITAGTPAITQINPNIGVPNSTVSVTLTGQYTNWTSASTVTFGTASSGISVGGAAAGSAGPVVAASATATSLTVSLNIATGAPLGPVDVAVTTGGSTQTVPGGFTVQAASISAPSLISLSPGMNAGSTGPSGTVSINSSLTAVFSQPMNRTTFTSSTVLLYLASNPSGWYTVPVTINVDATGRVLTVTPNSLMAVNTQYYLNLTSGIKDATGNSLSSYGQYFYTDYAANSTPATVITTSIPNGATGVATNAMIQLQFSTDMNQATQSGFTVSGSGGNVAGTISWNSSPYGSPSWGPGTILTFTPSVPLAASTIYTLVWNTPLADTAGNAVTPGSLTFTTGTGADTAQNYTGADFANYLTNVGTNFAPKVTYSKPINPLNINTSTLMMYNADSGKYVQGTVTVAPNGLSATFTPIYPLLPNTYYYIHQAWGYYDVDGNYLNGIDRYFTTGAGSDLAVPTVASVSPANGSTSVPLNAQIVAHFSEAINPTSAYSITVTPAGGSAIAGTATLGSDQVTLTFAPSALLQGGTIFTVQVSGFVDLAGNAGTTTSSTFTTMTSVTPLNVSTGLDAGGHLITASGASDPHWFVNGTATNAKVVVSGNADWYSGWLANGPNSDWIAPNPTSSATAVVGDTLSTTFNWSGSTTNICLVGGWAADDWGTLALNGTALLTSGRGYSSFNQLNVPIGSYLVAGANTLTLTWTQADGSMTGYRLQATIQTCGATLAGGLSLVSATPAYNAPGVATNSTITLVFNHPLDPATVNSSTLPVMVDWNSNQIVAGAYVFGTTNVPYDTVIFVPDSPLPINRQIWVGACNGPYDIAGNSIGGCYTQLTYFTTNGTATPIGTPFHVVAFTPADGAPSVGLRAPVVATFDRSVNPGSINSSDFGLFNGDSQSPWCTSPSRSQDNTSVAFNCYALPSSANMTAILNSGIQDWNGNALVNYTSHFTTTYYDYNTHGSVSTQRPGNGASGINVNEPITIYTNVPINPSTANAGFEVAQNNVAVPGTVNVQDSGYTLVFTPSVPWTPGALIQWWTTGALSDTSYNAYINSASGYFYVAGDTSTLTPTVQVISPTNGATVALNTIFDVQFNTPLNPATVTSTNIYLYDSTSGLHLPGTYTMPQPNVVRIVPSSAFSSNRYIYLYVKSGLQSATSVPAVNNSWYAYTGNPADTTLPVVTSAVPFNGSSGNGVNIAPGVIFNKPIDPVSVNSSTFQVLNGATPLAGGYWFNSTNTRVEFVPNAPLPASSNLTMSLTGVLDLVGNPVTFSSTFQTSAYPDIWAPSVVWSSVTNSGSIPTNSSITIQFSESMDSSTFSSGNFYIYDNLLGNRIAATLTWSSDQSTAYLTPASPLAAGRQYSLNVSSGTDLAGNQMSGYSATFYAAYTSASVAPTVINFNPIGGMTGLGTNVIVEAQFSGPIDPNTLSNVTLQRGSFTVLTTPVMSAGNTVLQLVPNIPLAANTAYVMTIAGVKDPAGNTVATVTNSFQTGPTYDISNASVITIDPPNNARVGTNVVPKMVFNKPLNPITVSNSTFRMYLNDIGQWIPLTVTQSPNGTIVTLQPQIPLLPNTEYYFQVCCNVQDQDGNNVNGGTWYFYTSNGDNHTAPTVAISPLDTSTGVPLNAKVRATVSAPIDATSWDQNSIQLLNGATPVAGTVSQPNNQVLVFAPAGALSAGTTYTVNVSGFKDANGNTVTPTSTTFTTGATAYTGAFNVISSNISNGASNVSATSQIILTFSQVLDPTTVNSNTLEVMDTWNSNRGLSGTYTVNGAQVTFIPDNPYPAGAQIYVGSCNGPTDVLGDVLSGCYSQVLNFYVSSGAVAPTAFTVLSVSPANGATNVRHDQPVSVTFSNSVYNNSTSSYNTQLYAGQDLQTNGSVTMSSDGRTMTFNIGALNNGTTYTIAIPAGGVSDEWGNTLASNFISTFTTASNPATGNGSVQNVTPNWGATGIPTNSLLTLFMNRQINPATVTGGLTVTVNGQVYAGTAISVGGGYEIQFTPTVPFPYGAAVQWFLSGSVLDVYGDAFNSTNGAFYIVGAPANPATAQPQVIAVSPYCCGTTNVPTNAVIDIQYSQPIDATTLNTSSVNRNSGPATPFTVALAPGTTNVVRITPSTPWTASTWYAFCTTASVKGTNGVAAQSDCYATYFTTTAAPDTTSGTVTVGPPDGSVNVGTNAFIRLQFSKPVDKTTINATNVQITTGGNTIPGTWSYNIVNSDVVGANFYPVNPLPPSSTIQVSVSGLLDYAGNLFSEPTTQFTTAAWPDFSGPSVSFDFPYGATGIATNASFTCRYSEPIDPSSITPNGLYLYSYGTSSRVPLNPFIFSSDLMSVTMTPTAALPTNTYYYTCYSAIDLTGNAQGNNSVYFTTGSGPDSTGPALLQANPPNGMTNVPVNTNNGPWYGSSLGLLFNEPVAANSLGNITLTPDGGSPIPIGVGAQYGNTIVWVQLPWALAPNTTYTYNVSGVTDYNGNLMTPTTSTFTTGASYDFTSPTVASAYPANGTGSVIATTPLSITFSEAMDPVLLTSSQIWLQTHNTGTKVPTTLSLSPDLKTVTLTPAAALAATTIYDLVINGNNWWPYDIAGNSFSVSGYVGYNSGYVYSTFTTQ